ncbi:MAG: S-layer homology domain-containing protein [Clostridiales bacterium]|nr:S-layer homology domain-containing protein [Clostridiales bacterium]
MTAANLTGSQVSAPTNTVQKTARNAPEAPTAASVTDTSVTLNVIPGAEYRFNNGASSETIEALINNALQAVAKEEEKEEKPGTEAETPVPVVTIDLSGVKGAKTAEINAGAAQEFTGAAVAVTIKLPGVDITLEPASLDILAKATDEGETPVTIEAAAIPVKELKGIQAAQVKGYETVVNVDIFVGGTKVDVPVIVSLPYKLKPGENPVAVCVWHLDDTGNMNKLNGSYNADTGFITFTTPHQSFYVVGYDPVMLWVNIFSDVAEGSWYYESVAYANHYGLMGGYGDGSFAPQDKMTRAMFTAVLWNMENDAESKTHTVAFKDVNADDWYFGAVSWAAVNGLYNGVEIITTDEFGPSKLITRQEMAVILMNYALYKGYEVSAIRAMSNFADSHQISAWAGDAVVKLSEAGVFIGSGGKFKPYKISTRAEVAQSIKNFMRFVLGPRTESAEPR